MKAVKAVKAALLAMHYQNDVLHTDGKVRVGVAADDPARPRLIASAGRLIAAARVNCVPVIFVRIAFAPNHADCLRNCTLFRRVAETGAVQDGSWGAEFYGELAPLPGEAVVTHKRNNPFWASGLEEAVRATGASRLYVAGIATNHVVEHGARHASDLGYDVAVVADACSTAQAHLHAASLETLAMLADVIRVDEAIVQMGQQMAQQMGQQMAQQTGGPQ